MFDNRKPVRIDLTASPYGEFGFRTATSCGSMFRSALSSIGITPSPGIPVADSTWLRLLKPVSISSRPIAMATPKSAEINNAATIIILFWG